MATDVSFATPLNKSLQGQAERNAVTFRNYILWGRGSNLFCDTDCSTRSSLDYASYFEATSSGKS
jgi:hypothetical protein